MLRMTVKIVKTPKPRKGSLGLTQLSYVPKQGKVAGVKKELPSRLSRQAHRETSDMLEKGKGWSVVWLPFADLHSRKLNRKVEYTSHLMPLSEAIVQQTLEEENNVKY